MRMFIIINYLVNNKEFSSIQEENGVLFFQTTYHQIYEKQLCPDSTERNFNTLVCQGQRTN